MNSTFPICLSIIILTFLNVESYAQNFVKNGDFEKYFWTPSVDDLNECDGWFNPAIVGTPDYFNRAACPPNCNGSYIYNSVGIPENWFGDQDAHSGNGYIGIHMYDETYLPTHLNREYASSELKQPLEVGEKYRVEYWVSLGENGKYFGTPPQILFNFSFPYPYSEVIYASPQIYSTSVINNTLDWIKITQDFVADQPYTNLTIGNFFDSSDSRFAIEPLNTGNHKLKLDFFIDDISVTYAPPPKPNLGSDIIMCDNEKRTLSSNVIGYNYLWSTGEKSKNIEVDKAGTYVLTLEHKGLTNSDTIIVTTIPSPKINLGLDTGICTSDSIDITLTSEEGSYFLWKPSDSTTQSIHVNIYGTYSVHSLLENGCSSDDTIRIYNNCPPCFSELNFFPNPVKELLKMSFIYNYDKQQVKYRLISDIGQVVVSDYVDLKKGLNKLNIELPVLNTGIYFLEMNVECGKMRCPIMVKQSD